MDGVLERNGAASSAVGWLGGGPSWRRPTVAAGPPLFVQGCRCEQLQDQGGEGLAGICVCVCWDVRLQWLDLMMGWKRGVVWRFAGKDERGHQEQGRVQVRTVLRSILRLRYLQKQAPREARH
jgi:hypothetical protein